MKRLPSPDQKTFAEELLDSPDTSNARKAARDSGSEGVEMVPTQRPCLMSRLDVCEIRPKQLSRTLAYPHFEVKPNQCELKPTCPFLPAHVEIHPCKHNIHSHVLQGRPSSAGDSLPATQAQSPQFQKVSSGVCKREWVCGCGRVYVLVGVGVGVGVFAAVGVNPLPDG